MNNRLRFLMKPAPILGFVLVSLIVISCSSTPAAGPETTAAKAAASQTESTAALELNYHQLGALLAQAREKRQEVTENKLEKLDEALFVQADNAFLNAEKLFNKGETALSAAEKSTAFKEAELALTAYSTLVDKHWFAIASEAKERSENAQQDALKLKADVAVRDDYNLTTEIHNQGEAAFKGKDYKHAVGYYNESAALYVTVAGVAAEKRRLATLALQSAESKILESEKIAADADTVLNPPNSKGAQL